MPGTTIASLKKHYDLIPLLLAVGTASTLAVGMTIRTALRNPDVSWNKRTNPEPWNQLDQAERFKFLNSKNVNYDNRRFPNERPPMDNEKYKNI